MASRDEGKAPVLVAAEEGRRIDGMEGIMSGLQDLKLGETRPSV
jgi:hypothetical protein